MSAREIVTIAPDAVLPDEAEVRVALDIPPGVSAGARTDALVREAIAILSKVGSPVGIYLEIARDEFATIYAGEGRNAGSTPLDRVRGQADRLALYAATMGEPICDRIRTMFASDDFALGLILDAAASLASERAGDAVRMRFAHTLGEATPGRAASLAALTYSPGYCGWDVTGQRSLFAVLRPEEIGIRLNDSCLMQPLKSVSGVIVAGPPEIHRFEENWPFCTDCVTRECRDRIRRLTAGAA